MTTRREMLLAGLAISAAAAPVLATAQAEAADGNTAEDTMARVSRTKVVRLGAVAGGAPFTDKDLTTGEWKGFCVDFAKDIASTFDAQLEIVETTWGNAALDLQSNKVDLFFGLSPTPKRALVVDFCNPLFKSAFAMISRTGFKATTWRELNKPEVTIAVDMGSSHDQIVGRVCPDAKVMKLKTVEDAVAAVQAGRADCQIVDVFLALTMVKKNPQLGEVSIPSPAYGASTNGGFRREGSSVWRDFVNVWINYQKDIGGVHEMVIRNMADVGVTAKDIPDGMDL